jgi:hypothetical protein
MSDASEINIFKALDWIRDNAQEMAQAKATRVQLEEFRKSKKALLMRDAEKTGINSAVGTGARSLCPSRVYPAAGRSEDCGGSGRAHALDDGGRATEDRSVAQSLESSRRIEAKTL